MILPHLPKGNIETRSLSPIVMSRNVALRNELDLFVNVLHCTSFPGIQSRHQNIDIAVIRQNTEGEYAMMEHEVNNFIVFFRIVSFFGLVFTDLCSSGN